MSPVLISPLDIFAMPIVTPAKGSVSRSPTTAKPASPSAPTSTHANELGWSPPLSTNPSNDNLTRYVTPSSTWDGRSIQALSDIATLQSPGGSSTYLIPRRQIGNESPLDVNSEATAPVYDGKNNIWSLSQTIHEKIHPEPPYHVFSHKKKKMLMFLAAVRSKSVV